MHAPFNALPAASLICHNLVMEWQTATRMAEENVDEERVSMEEEQAMGSGGEVVAEEELLGEEGMEVEGHNPEAIPPLSNETRVGVSPVFAFAWLCYQNVPVP